MGWGKPWHHPRSLDSEPKANTFWGSIGEFFFGFNSKVATAVLWFWHIEGPKEAAARFFFFFQHNDAPAAKAACEVSNANNAKPGLSLARIHNLITMSDAVDIFDFINY